MQGGGQATGRAGIAGCNRLTVELGGTSGIGGHRDAVEIEAGEIVQSDADPGIGGSLVGLEGLVHVGVDAEPVFVENPESDVGELVSAFRSLFEQPARLGKIVETLFGAAELEGVARLVGLCLEGCPAGFTRGGRIDRHMLDAG